MVENHHPASFRPTAAAMCRVFIGLTLLAMLIKPAMLEAQNAAASAPSIRYTVRFPDPASHYASVEAVVPAGGRSSVELFMAVWTPGSYLVREFARNVEGVRATDAAGHPLAVEKSRKNRWRVETGGAAEIHFSYRLYCREMSVRTNWVEDKFALLNGAATFVSLVGGLKLQHDVRLELPAAWKSSITAMPDAPDGAAHHYLAPDYDTLVDSPILLGNPAVHRFDVNGIPHLLVDEGEAGVFDGARAAADVEKLVRAYRQMWGALPYSGRYVFLNLLVETGGGLEHRNSVCMMASRFATRTRRAYLSWLDLASHEYFHAWNIKRLRPVELGPFDYENETPTRSLWIAEGFTDYYGSLALRRTGLASEAEYVGSETPPAAWSLSGMIGTVQSAPGRLEQSLEEASYDAWIKFYRPDENSANSSISYYTKGALVGWLLDARVRKATAGKKSLDDVMRLAFARFSGERGFTTEAFKQLAAEVAGVPLGEFFRQNVEAAGELDYNEALDWFGLRFRPAAAAASNGNGGKKANLGILTKVDSGRLVVTRVPRATAAFAAGLAVDDEIVAIDDFRVRAEQFAQRLENYHAGDKVTLLVARRDQMMRLNVTLGEEAGGWQLEVRPDASAEQKKRLEAWTGK